MRLPDEDVKPGRAYNGSMNGKNGIANGNGSTRINTLPIDRVRLELVGMIREHDTLIVMGETGSGKTTQLPQIIQNARLVNGLIGITQPRRVAAISVARRVAEERKVDCGAEVGYCVRFDDKTSGETRIKYATDGMLLREAQSDPTLRKYGCIILDEAHERTVHTDILFGIVKKAQRVRLLKAGMPRLKVIVMSATMDVDHFSKYFNSKVLYLEGRTHPIDIRYSLSNYEDYMGATLATILDLHGRLPTSESILVFLTGQEEIEACKRTLMEQMNLPTYSNTTKMEILTLYAAVSYAQQMKVFEPGKPNKRRVILSTNIAETSVTIPGIKHVIDPGKVKQKNYHPGSGMELLKITQCSKAQAWQRAGRAGRESSGSVYRLYTEETFNNMSESTKPEIQRTPLSNVAMQMMAANVKDIIKFEFLDIPPRDSLNAALKELSLLKVSTKTSEGEGYELTDYGKKIARFPLEPRLTKALMVSAQHKCSEEAITIAAFLSGENVFLTPSNKREEAKIAHSKFHSSEGDFITMLNVWKGWKRAKMDKHWCHSNFLQVRHLQHIGEIRKQLREIFVSLALDLKSSPDTELIRRSFARGLFMNCAELKPDGRYEEIGHNQTVRIHPSSCLFGSKPPFVVFNELVETNKLYIRSIIPAEPEWVIPEAPDWFKTRLSCDS